MTQRTTFTLDDDVFAFLNAVAGSNRSAYINQLIKQEKLRTLEQAILKANQEEANDGAYQESLAEWDVTLQDGLNP